MGLSTQKGVPFCFFLSFLSNQNNHLYSPGVTMWEKKTNRSRKDGEKDIYWNRLRHNSPLDGLTLRKKEINFKD